MKKFLLVALMSLLVTSCGAPVAGPKAVDDATLHDFVFSVEQRHDGSTFMWIRNDGTGIYCLPTAALYAAALKVVNTKTAEVIVHYKSLNASLTTSEYPQCTSAESGGDAQSKSTVYVVSSIEAAGQADLGQ